MKFTLVVLTSILGVACAQNGGSGSASGSSMDPSGGSGGSGDMGGALGLGGGGGGCVSGAQPCKTDKADECCSGKCNEIAGGNGFCEKTDDQK